MRYGIYVQKKYVKSTDIINVPVSVTAPLATTSDKAEVDETTQQSWTDAPVATSAPPPAPVPTMDRSEVEQETRHFLMASTCNTCDASGIPPVETWTAAVAENSHETFIGSPMPAEQLLHETIVRDPFLDNSQPSMTDAPSALQLSLSGESCPLQSPQALHNAIRKRNCTRRTPTQAGTPYQKSGKTSRNRTEDDPLDEFTEMASAAPPPETPSQVFYDAAAARANDGRYANNRSFWNLFLCYQNYHQHLCNHIQLRLYYTRPLKKCTAQHANNRWLVKVNNVTLS